MRRSTVLPVTAFGLLIAALVTSQDNCQDKLVALSTKLQTECGEEMGYHCATGCQTVVSDALGSPDTKACLDAVNITTNFDQARALCSSASYAAIGAFALTAVVVTTVL
jgi:hypothetical protein